MLSPGRSSSCSPALSDGPDFLEFAVNHLSVDDENEFLFPVVKERKFGDSLVNASNHHETPREESVKVEERKFGDSLVNASNHHETPREESVSVKERKFGDGCVTSDYHETPREEFQRLENGADQDTPAQLQQLKESENSRGENPNTETNSSAGCNERKPSTDHELPRPSSEQGKTSRAEELNTMYPGKMPEMSGSSDSKAGSKLPEAPGSFKELGAVTKSAAIWKRRVFTESHDHRFEISHQRDKRNSVRKLGDCSLLRNMPHNKDRYSNKQRKLDLYDVAANVYAKNRESKRDSTLKGARYLSLAERSGAKWLQNTVRSKKIELPPIDVVSRKRYSTHWSPQKSIPPHGEVNVSNEYSTVQRDTRKQSDSDNIVLKSLIETLEATHLRDQNKVEVLKHSLASLSRNSNQANFKKKALPLVKSALAFKHYGNKSS